MIEIEKNCNKKVKTNQIIMYIRGTSSNIFISFFKKAYINKTDKSIYLGQLLRTFSCGSFKSNIGKKDSLFNINKLVVRSLFYLKKEDIYNIHIIINNVTTVKKYILYNIFNVSYKITGLKLLSLIDITHYSYTKYKIKKDKRR